MAYKNKLEILTEEYTYQRSVAAHAREDVERKPNDKGLAADLELAEAGFWKAYKALRAEFMGQYDNDNAMWNDYRRSL